MDGTIKLDDMRLFARVAEAQGFTAAARVLGIPKQTLSRRVGELERALGVSLMQRTTRRLHLSDVGARYAERCAELVRLADDANRAASDAREVPQGTLRISADPVFGDAFLTELVLAYARKWPAVRLDVVLTRRRVDLVEEGFDVAFRIGAAPDVALSGFELAPARVRYCASPRYLARHGAPATPADLTRHDCIVVAAEAGPARWPFRGRRGLRLVPVTARLTATSFAMARAATLAGLGIGLFPAFTCAADLAARRLRGVLDDWVVDVGAVWLLHPPRRHLTARVRAFIDLTRQHFRGAARERLSRTDLS